MGAGVGGVARPAAVQQHLQRLGRHDLSLWHCIKLQIQQKRRGIHPLKLGAGDQKMLTTGFQVQGMHGADGRKHKQAELGARARHRCHADVALQSGHCLGHRIQADAPPRGLGHRAAGAEARQEDQAANFLLAQFCVCRDQAAPQRLVENRLVVQAASIVRQGDGDATAKAGKRHADRALRGLACRQALLGCLDAVVHAVAQQVQQGFRQRPEHGRIDPQVIAGDLKQGLAADRLAGLAHGSAHAGAQAGQGTQARLGELKAGFARNVKLPLGQRRDLAQRGRQGVTRAAQVVNGFVQRLGCAGQLVVAVHFQGIKSGLRGLRQRGTGPVRACRANRPAQTLQCDALLDVCQALRGDLVQRRQCVASDQDVVVLGAKAQQPDRQLVDGAKNFVQGLGRNADLKLIFRQGFWLARCGSARGRRDNHRPDGQGPQGG